ncbi:O-antigen ligase [Caldicoprobacter guelmensis]|uniref:O-antigen ligase family protein n=1 Tax=Caldicoprobacter guelmensis TaxID=1170224 RepID=UPI00195E53D3|nr:O-antigen ligase family protein [Caldicoprobacter guelmensis]MBM7581192.1 O-antigen ligase [Caldicoprobacter guelmensis]
MKLGFCYKDSFSTVFKFTAFVLIFFLCLYIRNVILSVAMLLILIAFEKSFFIAILLLLPIVETLMVFREGLTITKIFSILLLIYLVAHIIRWKKIHMTKGLGVIIVFLTWTVVGIFNHIVLFPDGAFSSWNYAQALYEGVIYAVSKIFFAMLIYIYLMDETQEELSQIMYFSSKSLTLGLIIVNIYFIFFGYEQFAWWSLTRVTFLGADPNEFACLLSALLPFSFWVFFSIEAVFWKIASLSSVILTIYSIILTLSRGGLLTLIFTLMVLFFLFLKKGRGKHYLLIFFLSLALVFLTQFIDISQVQARFSSTWIQNSLSKLTARRIDWWMAALEKWLERPIIGWGTSATMLQEWLNFEKYGIPTVLHSIYVEIILQLGIVGIGLFMLIIMKAIGGIPNILKQTSEIRSLHIIIPMISLLSVLFAGLSLSWEWKEFVWFLISISLAYTDKFTRVSCEY